MLCINWISYEVGFFILGLIDVVQLDIGTILLQLVNMYYMVHVGWHSMSLLCVCVCVCVLQV